MVMLSYRSVTRYILGFGLLTTQLPGAAYAGPKLHKVRNGSVIALCMQRAGGKQTAVARDAKGRRVTVASLQNQLRQRLAREAKSGSTSRTNKLLKTIVTNQAKIEACLNRDSGAGQAPDSAATPSDTGSSRPGSPTDAFDCRLDNPFGDRNGYININDAMGFMNMYAKSMSAHDLSADFNQDGAVNSQDVGAYLVAFNASTPTSALVCGTTPTPTPTPGGFTQFVPASDTQRVYVSSSQGADANDGLDPSRPVRSLARGYSLIRNGSADWLLLKSGDTWHETFGAFTKNGRSNAERLLIGSYGTGDRPKLLTGVSPAIYSNNTNSQGALAGSNVIISDLDMYMDQNDGTQQNGAVMFFNKHAHILIENCRMTNYSVGIVVQEANQDPLIARTSDLKVRYVVVNGTVHYGDGHSQGMFLGNIDGMVLENNAILRASLGQETKFSHAVYAHELSGPMTVRNNIFSSPHSAGDLMIRPGGVVEGNVGLRNSIHLTVGASEVSPTNDNIVRNNLAVESRDSGGDARVAYAFSLGSLGGGIVEGNLAVGASSGTETITAMDISNINNVTFTKNVVYHWMSNPVGWSTGFSVYHCSGATSFTNNMILEAGARVIGDMPGCAPSYSNNIFRGRDFAGAEPSLPNTNVSIEGFAASVGVPATLDSLLNAIAEQRRGSYRSDLSAQAINNYFRQGFGMPAVQ